MSDRFNERAILDALRPSLTGLRPPADGARSAVLPEAAAEAPLGVLMGFVSEHASGPTTVWSGKGFNIVELPNRNMENPPHTPKFQVKLNAYTEKLTFTRFANDAPAPNRGDFQEDIDIHAIQYFQQIDDVAGGGIHSETGMWLIARDPKVAGPSPMLARLGVIPHGDSILCQGFSIGQRLQNTPPSFVTADTTPFTLDGSGRRVNDTSENYLRVIRDAPLPPGITPAIVDNPNLLLQQHLTGTTVLEMDVLIISANPIAGIDDVRGPFENVGKQGGIVNIPFVVKNANSNSITCIFWLEKMRDDTTGTEFLQVQYSQTVILDFPVLGGDGNPLDIKWPHMSVATLREPGAPPLP